MYAVVVTRLAVAASSSAMRAAWLVMVAACRAMVTVWLPIRVSRLAVVTLVDGGGCGVDMLALRVWRRCCRDIVNKGCRSSELLDQGYRPFLPVLRHVVPRIACAGGDLIPFHIHQSNLGTHRDTRFCPIDIYYRECDIPQMVSRGGDIGIL
jgi:hypothetical protein